MVAWEHNLFVCNLFVCDEDINYKEGFNLTYNTHDLSFKATYHEFLECELFDVEMNRPVKGIRIMLVSVG